MPQWPVPREEQTIEDLRPDIAALTGSGTIRCLPPGCPTCSAVRTPFYTRFPSRCRKCGRASASQTANLLSGKRDEKTYCLTEKCSQRVKRCLTKHAPVASLASGRANP